jgi:signal transduction histidine kinase
VDVIAALRAIDLFEDVDDDALAPFAATAEEVHLAPGDSLVPGFVNVLVAGRLEWHRDLAGEQVLLGAQEAPGYAGAINALTAEPLSIAARVAAATTLLRFPAQAFRDLAAREPRLVGRVVRLAGIVSSTNEATLRERERLAALGGLAAGLAHELGNPASAAVRVAAELRDAVGVLGPVVAPVAPDGADPLAEAEREEALAEALQAGGVADAWALAPDLARTGLTAADVGPSPDAAALTRLAAATRAAELLDELQSAVGRVFTLVRAMGEYTQLDRGPEQELDVGAGLESTLAVLHARLDAVVVRTELPPGLPPVAVSAAELNQVWTQLLLNAAEAAPGGTVTVSARARDGAVEVTVADDGPGVPAHLRDRVFEPFFTTKEVGHAGLGLDVARRAAERTGATLTLTGPSRFTVTLPAAT